MYKCNSFEMLLYAFVTLFNLSIFVNVYIYYLQSFNL